MLEGKNSESKASKIQVSVTLFVLQKAFIQSSCFLQSTGSKKSLKKYSILNSLAIQPCSIVYKASFMDHKDSQGLCPISSTPKFNLQSVKKLLVFTHNNCHFQANLYQEPTSEATGASSFIRLNWTSDMSNFGVIFVLTMYF